MTVFFPVVELVDRYVIAMVKHRRTNGINQQELDYYQTQIDHLAMQTVQSDLCALVDIHETIWNLESDLKNGHESNLPLEEIGRRAIVIRDWNNKRIAVKNRIAQALAKDTVREVKREHLSE